MSNAKTFGMQLHTLLCELKQIPRPKPILGSPRVQGWLCGVASALAEGMNEAEAQAAKAEFYVTAFDGTSMGQAFGLDMLINSSRIVQAGPTMGYNAIYHEFIEKGRASMAGGVLNSQVLEELLAK